MSKIQFLALGGQDERGKNLFLLNINDEIIIFEAGVKYPDKGILGIDVVVPTIDYLKKHKDKVKGVFITNPASINAGAISFLVKEINPDIYCNNLVCEILKNNLTSSKGRMRIPKIKVISAKEPIKISPSITIEAFRTTSSFPNSLGFAVHTDSGVIVYAGDYVMDGTAKGLFSTDMQHIQKIASKKILAFISDSEYATRLDFTSPNAEIGKYINGIIKEVSKKLIVGIFAEDFYKLFEIIKQAKLNERKVAIYGPQLSKLLKQNTELQKQLGIVSSDIIHISEYNSTPGALLIITGFGSVLYNRLVKMAIGSEPSVTISEDDIILLATPPAAGIEKKHAETLDELARTNARLIALSDKNIWSMRASYEDIKLMTKILNPLSFIPVKGLYKDFVAAKNAAADAGVNPKNIEILNNGQILEILEDGALKVSKNLISTDDIYIDSSGVSEITEIVLNERRQLATDGVIIAGINIDAASKELISLIDVQLRGVIFIQEDSKIFKLIQEELQNILNKWLEIFKKNPKEYLLNEIKREMVSKVRNLVKLETGKKPIVIVVINESQI